MSAFEAWRSGPGEVLIAEAKDFRLMVHAPANDGTARFQVYRRNQEGLVGGDTLIASGHRDSPSAAMHAARKVAHRLTERAA